MQNFPWQYAVITAAAVVLALLMLFFAIRRLRRRPAADDIVEPSLAIQVSQLGEYGPPNDGATIELYNVPVRLALFVLAPVGRERTLPDKSQLPQIVDELLPNMMAVLSSHRPEYHVWPAQLSVAGFTRVFFTVAALPGNRGKGSPWSSIAGPFEAGGERYLAGMVFCADRPNSLSEFTVQRPTQWLDFLRIRVPS